MFKYNNSFKLSRLGKKMGLSTRGLFTKERPILARNRELVRSVSPDSDVRGIIRHLAYMFSEKFDSSPEENWLNAEWMFCYSGSPFYDGVTELDTRVINETLKIKASKISKSRAGSDFVNWNFAQHEYALEVLDHHTDGLRMARGYRYS